VYRHFGIDDNTVRPTGDTVSWWCKSFGAAAADVIFLYYARQHHLKGKKRLNTTKLLLLLLLLSTIYHTHGRKDTFFYIL
jgi:hypothetical protein